jgi:hypothetical protein
MITSRCNVEMVTPRDGTKGAARIAMCRRGDGARSDAAAETKLTISREFGKSIEWLLAGGKTRGQLATRSERADFSPLSFALLRKQQANYRQQGTMKG